MKILAINGSYRKNGNTSRIIQMMVAEFQKIASKGPQDLTVEIIQLGHQKIKFCRGCRVCFDQGEGKCPLQDNLLAIFDKIEDADGLILASPVYVNDVSGIMKNWIDRMAFVCHRPAFAGKRAFILTTVGLGPTKHAERTLYHALTTWGFTVAGQVGFKMGARMSTGQVNRNFKVRIRKVAAQYYRTLQKPAVPSFSSLLTFRIQQGYWREESVDDSIDGRYWRSQGWTQIERNYYVPHQASRSKVVLARLVGMILTPFVT
jgi:multimeric flavodoxin WrbA